MVHNLRTEIPLKVCILSGGKPSSLPLVPLTVGIHSIAIFLN
jgi:hypothetical protein